MYCQHILQKEKLFHDRHRISKVIQDAVLLQPMSYFRLPHQPTVHPVIFNFAFWGVHIGRGEVKRFTNFMLNNLQRNFQNLLLFLLILSILRLQGDEATRILNSGYISTLK